MIDEDHVEVEERDDDKCHEIDDGENYSDYSDDD